ncbi:hypothetical protein BEL04_08400 [Mucilaginibacter sp. PPCGB 2223]|uniref:DUF3892 domain-containing protein n=1 Tax=Mucilaginibacter sp. PPCGB 2223 TaxID=1886027 RepID=UPI000855CA05|nr:DUF3892 domain-containing protein [Mucilaginibacter sp. PPCGB 2223]OCX54268.1 hypothetical protein BEL04_08400 [Mucilaginibacter sp. PPCGB 2223]
MSVRITCIKKAAGDHENPYVAISSMSWINEQSKKTGTATRIEVYDFVKDGGEAYVKDADGNKAKLLARTTAKGTKYVKTEADDVKSDNLLKLKEC